ncbi:histidine phosphatase family protein [Sphingomonas sp. TREG-RG-20F-R18-01]|uniref:histidine phosphatase family protein n=1 Tax=Sphingomonas sp. TREG-RG-20F-R18-01 TaxID=2914982 RepID=UPI001F5A0420|nr:histidine phosphatase family protein [Sphingomonas sp. TREG-RG-20F-R18-01]
MDLTLVIVRHGNTFAVGEPARRIGAATDLPLVESGVAQAQALGLAFARQGLRFDRALAAPLLRTRATIAGILADQPDAPRIEAADWLTEIDHGPDEGRLEQDVVARLGMAALARWDTAAQVPPGWVVDVDQRIEGWRTLMTTVGGCVLVVTSNGAARFALHADPALQRDASQLASLKLRTGAYAVIERRAGILRLAVWDRRP